MARDKITLTDWKKDNPNGTLEDWEKAVGRKALALEKAVFGATGRNQTKHPFHASFVRRQEADRYLPTTFVHSY